MADRRIRVALAVLSGVLFWFAFRLTPWWPAAWLAPIPLLPAAFHSSGREASVLAWLAAGIGLSSNLPYYVTTTGPVVAVIITVLQMLAWGFFVSRARAAVLLGSGMPAVFVLPTLMAAMDTLVAWLSPHGTWGSYAYSQMDALPVIQIASGFGEAGVIFVVGLFASTVAVALYRGPRPAHALPLILVALIVFCGDIRLRVAPTTPVVRVGLASVDNFIARGRDRDAVWRRYPELVKELAGKGARIVVLPEKIDALETTEAKRRTEEFEALAKQSGVWIVAGMQVNEPDRKENVSWVISPDGNLKRVYRKQHMVPYLEGDLTPGTAFMTQKIGEQTFGLAICRDMIFTGFGDRYGDPPVAAVLVPGWDFYSDAWMASGIAAMRGVENGYAVIRAGRESYLNVTDRFGRIIARKRSDFLPGASLISDVPLSVAPPTLFTRFGNLFGALWIAAATGILIRSRRRSV